LFENKKKGKMRLTFLFLRSLFASFETHLTSFQLASSFETR
jgi:hypothetical protein